MKVWVAIFFTIGFWSCHHQKNNKPTIKYFDVFEFYFDNHNPNYFGLETFENDEGIGPKSLAIYQDFVFIIDPVHSNIKRIDLNSGKQITSTKLGEGRAWLRDIAVHRDRIWVLTDLHQNFMLEISLEDYTTFELPNGPKTFLFSEDDKIEIYSFYKKTLFDENGRQLTTENKFRDVYRTGAKKEFSFENGKVETPFGIYFLSVNFETTTEFFDSFNMDFSTSYLVFFTISLEKMRLFVYRNN